MEACEKQTTESAGEDQEQEDQEKEEVKMPRQRFGSVGEETRNLFLDCFSKKKVLLIVIKRVKSARAIGGHHKHPSPRVSSREAIQKPAQTRDAGGLVTASAQNLLGCRFDPRQKNRPIVCVLGTPCSGWSWLVKSSNDLEVWRRCGPMLPQEKASLFFLLTPVPGNWRRLESHVCRCLPPCFSCLPDVYEAKQKKAFSLEVCW